MSRAKSTAIIAVRGLSAAHTRGWLSLGDWRCRCALGRSGVVARKHEGDGGSPRGSWRLAGVYYRADRMRRPRTGLPLRQLRPDDGWCDAVGDRNYNRAVRHPYPASAERLWRDDHLYDLVVVLDHNRQPRRRGGGSAIVLHIARPDRAPTEGCVAVSAGDLLFMLARLHRGARLRIAC